MMCLFVLTQVMNVTDRQTYRHCVMAKAVLNASIVRQKFMHYGIRLFNNLNETD